MGVSLLVCRVVLAAVFVVETSGVPALDCNPPVLAEGALAYGHQIRPATRHRRGRRS